MVLHVARRVDVIGKGKTAQKLIQDRPERLLHEVCEHVQPAAVGHAEHHFLQPQLRAALEDLLQRRDHGLAAVQPEALGARELLVEEVLEALRMGQALKDRLLPHLGEVGLVLDRLDPLLHPGLLRRVGDVHELDPDAPAVGRAATVEDLLDRGVFTQPQHVVDVDLAVHVRGAEAIGLGVQLFVGQPLLQTQRVEVGDQVPPDAVGADHHQRADRVLCGALGGLTIDGRTGSRRSLFCGFGGSVFVRYAQQCGCRAHASSGPENHPAAQLHCRSARQRRSASWRQRTADFRDIARTIRRCRRVRPGQRGKGIVVKGCFPSLVQRCHVFPVSFPDPLACCRPRV